MEHLSGKAFLGLTRQTERTSQTRDTGRSRQGKSGTLVKLHARIENASAIGIVINKLKVFALFSIRNISGL